jgi:hypothetical protein
MANMRSAAELLGAYPEHVRELADATRRFVQRVLPDAHESADSTAPLLAYAYAPGYRGVAATIILSKTGVKLGVFGGARLPDPRGLLEGSGKVHRYVQLKTVADLKRPGITALLKGARKMCHERLRASSARSPRRSSASMPA